MRKIKYSFFISLTFLAISLKAQNYGLVFNNNIYMNITNSANLVIDNPNTSGITVANTGNIISEGENNVVKWNIGANTGVYKVPFTSSLASGLVKIPLEVNVTTAGTGTGTIIFSTFETTNDDNTAYPSDVANMNSNCNNNNGLFAVDRFWRIDAQNYTTKPTPVINFGYNPNASETGVTNTIAQAALKAERFNAGANSWETPQKLYGSANTASNVVNGVSVLPADFHKSWTLIDTTIMTFTVTALSSSVCAGSQATINPTGGTTYTLMPGALTSTTNFTVIPTTNTTYTISGTIGTGTATCNSILSTNATPTIGINALPLMAITGNSVICSGNTATLNASTADMYSWDNGTTTSQNLVSPITNTVYMAVGTNTYASGNCTATTVFSVNVSLPPTVAINSPTVCNGNWASLSATVTPSANITYTWDNGASTATIYGTIIYSTTTTHTLQVSDGICNVTTNATVNVAPSPTITASSNPTICAGTTITLTTITSPQFVEWTSNNGVVSSNTFAVVAPSVTTTYTVSDATISVPETYCFNLPTTVTVNVIANPTVTIVSNTLCAGNSAILTANANPTAGTTYSWSQGGITTNTISVNPTTNTDFTVTVTNNGCLGSAVATATVYPIGTPTTGFSYNSPICIADVNQLPTTSAGFASSGVYSASTGLTVNATTGEVNLTASTAGTYVVTYSVAPNGCTSAGSSSVAVVIQAIPSASVANFSYNSPICLDNSSTTASVIAGGTYNNGEYSATPAGLSVNNLTGEIDLTNSAPGVYTINYAFNGIIDCSQTYTGQTTVTIVASPTITASPDVTINLGSSAVITATSSPNTYTWFPTTNLSCVNCDSPVASPSVTTNYCVKTIDGVCSNTVCLKVIVENPCPTNNGLLLPNAFSPNGDGNNDLYCFQGWSCVSAFSIMIFDRWGEKVFETTDPASCWDGTYNGRLLDPAVFVYYAKVTFNGGATVDKKGNITLIN